MAEWQRSSAWSLKQPKIEASTLDVLFLGTGRLCRHLDFYFSKVLALKTEKISWTRISTINILELSALKPRVIFLLGKDSQLAEQAKWVRDHGFAVPMIHCSGLAKIDDVSAWHPLGSFSDSLFSPALYKELPFVGDENSVDLKMLLPELPNKSLRINQSQKDLYHALCVMGSNLTSILWTHVQARAQKEIQIPKDMFHFLMKSSLENIVQQGLSGVTGPVTRGDVDTMKKNQRSLGQGPDAEIYQLITQIYLNQFSQKEPLHVDSRH